MKPSKIAVAFKYVDQNGSGTVNKDEINQILHLDGKKHTH
jgi:Ca2+-binding EF-hand superfamily protein